jgi:hypothetical protein
MCDSIYFAGLEDLSLEISTSARPIDGRAWIDPEVVALAGIDAEELARFRRPAPFARPAQPISQPALDEAKPMPRGWAGYAQLAAMDDDEFTKRMSITDPPVKVD